MLLGLQRFLFHTSAAKQDFNVEPAISRTMQDNIELWYAMYINEPPWAGTDIIPLGIPAAVSRELARASLVEFSARVEGSARAEYLDGCMQAAVRKIDKALELGLALGGLAFKPYLYQGRVLVDYASAANFQPTRFDPSGRCIGGVFRERIKSGGKWYVRMEHHDLRVETEEDGRQVTRYVVQNEAHESSESGTVGRRADLTEIPEWACLERETVIEGLERPLFAYFSTPHANNVEIESHAGMSIYGGAAVCLMKDADDQWERIWWEYKSGERKIFIDSMGESGKRMMQNRLYEIGAFTSSGDLFREFSPAFRDDALYRGFQNILKRIEFEVGLSYGTLSELPDTVKTASEVIHSKKRQFDTEKKIQDALGYALDDLVYAMDAYATLYNLAPAGSYELKLNFGDGVLDDPESNRAEKALDLSEMAAGVLNPWEYRMKWYDETEEEAKANLPGMETLATEPQQEVE